MFKIGLLSDTHGFLDPQLKEFFADVDEIWHAGDIGALSVCETLSNWKPLIAVYGNIDGGEIRKSFPLNQRHIREGLDIWMTHIGGYPGHYYPDIKARIRNNPPGLFISGHSHILKVIPDPALKLLHINPGAAGKYGFHLVRTAVRFVINSGRPEQLDIIELGKRSEV